MKLLEPIEECKKNLTENYLESTCCQTQNSIYKLEWLRKYLNLSPVVKLGNNEVTIKTNYNVKLTLPHDDVSTIVPGILKDGCWEMDTIFNYQYLLKRNATVIEVGACFGEHTTLAQIVGPYGHIHSFEASPTNFNQFLKLNIQNNKFSDRVTIYNEAVGNKNGKMEFYNQVNGYGWGRLYNFGEENKPKYIKQGFKFTDVPIITLDEKFKNSLSNIDLLKIDVEGFQCEVLGGAKKILENNPKIKIIVEWLTKTSNMEISMKKQADCVDMLTKAGFKYFYRPVEFDPFDGSGKKNFQQSFKNIIQIEQNFCTGKNYYEKIRPEFLKNFRGIFDFTAAKYDLIKMKSIFSEISQNKMESVFQNQQNNI